MDKIQTYFIITEKLNQTKLSFLVSNKYLYALVIFIFFIITAKLMLFIIEKYIKNLTKKTKTNIDDELIEAIRKPAYYLLTFIGILFAFFALQIDTKIMELILNLFFSLITIAFTIILIRVAKVFIDFWGKIWAKKSKSSLEYDLLPLMKKTSTVLLLVIGLLFILKIWGIDITGLLAGLGIAGIVIGFALKDSLSNVFGGISLILDKNIKRGDRIKIENGEIGTIEDIGIRSTKLLTFDNELIIIPNGILSNSRIQNYVLPEPAQRVKVHFGVEYGSDINKVRKVVLDTIKKLENVIKEPIPEMDFVEMGDFALLMVAKMWVNSYQNAYSVKVKATEEIYKALKKANINIPFPTRTIYMKK
ncbi:MAG: mechanosensitive ion channel family protein [Nanoarchaeota archaeon]|nr:mechanosensitive ion channel family protein [Nanoarchaeota archaeon]MBU4242363.1 mechanosensitive ion channel family protein [Nanoarchaeota archaeon]MBU4352161.1 mechanosensitive ion channel family protein [Nanoarchaeota archaeon]